MPGDKMRIAREIDSCLGFQHAHDGKRHRHQRGLRVLRERQLLRRSFPDDFREVLIEGGVNLGKDLACRHESIGKRLAHADCLTSLTRKYECGGHPTPLTMPITGSVQKARSAPTTLRAPLLERHC